MGYTKEQREAKKTTQDAPQADVVEKKYIKNIPLSANVWVYSNCYGELQYVSSKTGYKVVWDNYRSKQSISLDELITMKNTQRKFFENNWILISDFTDKEYEDKFSVEEILEFLQVKQYYDNILCPENIEEIFNMSAGEIEKRVPNMSSGIKNAISIRANELIESGNLDSLTKIKALEKTLGCELIRP